MRFARASCGHIRWHRAPRLRQLLESTVARLSRLEANPKQFGEDVATIQRVLHNAIALTVSLCDTLGLIGDQQASGQFDRGFGNCRIVAFKRRQPGRLRG